MVDFLEMEMLLEMELLLEMLLSELSACHFLNDEKPYLAIYYKSTECK
jgi:hypothetical protein